ncbi:MAG TPA: SOS response-associated peptidase [Allosphingosinicella sp.]|nr:SOS response-associated peptidase [Allosphingosinicella sp.]
MCNEHRRTVELGRISDAFAQLRIPLRFPEGAPNLAALESIRITDPTAIVRARGEDFELVQRRWSWPGPGGKPVFNYRGEAREFGNSPTSGRCLIVADGFYEYTDPQDGGRRKTRWLFTRAQEDLFGIAGLWRTDPKVGEACAMLTVEPGADVAPYHNRQIAVIERADWGAWLDASAPAAALLKPSPAGTFDVARA